MARAGCFLPDITVLSLAATGSLVLGSHTIYNKEAFLLRGIMRPSDSANEESVSILVKQRDRNNRVSCMYI